MDTVFVKSYISFIGMLISARPEYLSLVLGKISHGFTYRASRPLVFSAVRLINSMQNRACKHWT